MGTTRGMKMDAFIGHKGESVIDYVITNQEARENMT